MQDFLLDEDTWDIVIENDDFIIIDGPDMTNQNSKFRLNIVAGEMFDDTRQGVPWLTDMVSPDVSIQAKKQILRSVIMGTPGAISVDSMTMDVGVNGQASVKWTGTCQGGVFGSESAYSSAADFQDIDDAVAASFRWEYTGINYAETLTNV
ncbi:hypothetical protein NVP1123O_26 [Vibrio phage 1.123.O._10N.286.48.F3]|nr:hypothetical protein NVP1123O_26 [Vibrio phage 1.123.O._10N.286.48.F3]